MGKVPDGLVGVVHREGDSGSLELEDLVLDGLSSVLRNKADLELSCSGDDEVGRLVLVGVGMAADDDGLGPAIHEAGHVLHDDRLTEHSTS